MPFNRGARLELANDSPRTVRHLFYQVGWREEPARTEDLPALHAQYRQQRSTPGEPVTLLQATGRCSFHGLRLDLQGQAWWLKPPLRHLALPRGFGLGLLEGWERDGGAAGRRGVGGLELSGCVGEVTRPATR